MRNTLFVDDNLDFIKLVEESGYCGCSSIGEALKTLDKYKKVYVDVNGLSDHHRIISACKRLGIVVQLMTGGSSATKLFASKLARDTDVDLINKLDLLRGIYKWTDTSETEQEL